MDKLNALVFAVVPFALGCFFVLFWLEIRPKIYVIGDSFTLNIIFNWIPLLVGVLCFWWGINGLVCLKSEFEEKTEEVVR